MDNRTHHCIESAPNLPHPVHGAMGGLINDKYPIVCGGVNLVNQDFYDECHIFDIEGGMIAPTLPMKMAYSGKCFTYVAKSIANSTTYSRKPGDYNGTIIFEFDILKNSAPPNLKFTFFATVKTKITLLFCWTHSTLSSASKCDKTKETTKNFVKWSSLTKIQIDWG